MTSYEELIQKYIGKDENPDHEKLTERVMSSGNKNDKEALADHIIGNFGQCQYDYMCNKFNVYEEIQCLFADLDTAWSLNPNLPKYHYCVAHVHEMLSSTARDEATKIAHLEKSIEELRVQQAIEEDEAVLEDIASEMLTLATLKDQFTEGLFDELMSVLTKAVTLGAIEDRSTRSLFFRGGAIFRLVKITLDIGSLAFDNHEYYHNYFLEESGRILSALAVDNQEVYYHWADALKRAYEIPHNEQTRSKCVANILSILPEILRKLEDVATRDTHYLTSLYHLFMWMGSKTEDIKYFHTVLKHCMPAIEIDPLPWHHTAYAGDALTKIAFCLILQDKHADAARNIEKGLDIYRKADSLTEDFQLSINFGDYLMTYAELVRDFAGPQILDEAALQYCKAMRLGEKHYTSPYYGLALIELMKDNKKGCIDTLMQCGRDLSDEYHIHSFSDIMDKERFSPFTTRYPKSRPS